MPLPKDPIKLELWRERQRIVQTGKKQPESQILKRRETRLKNHPKVLTPCANCGKEKYHIPSRRGIRNYCNGKCQMEYEYKNGVRDPHKITMKSHEAMHNLIDKGEWSLQQPENIIKGHKACGCKNYGGTWIEKKMNWALTKLGIKFESQYPVKCGLDILNRPRYYFPDFALVDNNILIECDGSQYHKNKNRDNLRQARLEELGWTVMRFPEDNIKANVMECANKVKSVLPVV